MAVGFSLGARGHTGGQGDTKVAGFRASAVKVDITPQNSQWLSGYEARQSTGVLDNIYHRVVAFDSGDTQLYLISSDLCLFSPSLYDHVEQCCTSTAPPATSRPSTPCIPIREAAISRNSEYCWETAS
jgi:hypothetical protein